jgi:hypothetical protein
MALESKYEVEVVVPSKADIPPEDDAQYTL